MTDVDSRLRDLRGATAGRFDPPPPEVLERIEDSLVDARRRRPGPFLLVAAAVVAVVLLAAGLQATRGENVRAASAERSRFVAAMDRLCDQFIFEPAPVDVANVGPFARVPSALERLLLASKSVVPPPEAAADFEEAKRQLTTAMQDGWEINTTANAIDEHATQAGGVALDDPLRNDPVNAQKLDELQPHQRAAVEAAARVLAANGASRCVHLPTGLTTQRAP